MTSPFPDRERIADAAFLAAALLPGRFRRPRLRTLAEGAGGIRGLRLFARGEGAGLELPGRAAASRRGARRPELRRPRREVPRAPGGASPPLRRRRLPAPSRPRLGPSAGALRTEPLRPDDRESPAPDRPRRLADLQSLRSGGGHADRGGPRRQRRRGRLRHGPRHRLGRPRGRGRAGRHHPRRPRLRHRHRLSEGERPPREADRRIGGVDPFRVPPGTQPLPPFFPERNRIIASLSRGVVVVEAAERSGSLITARLALEEGREVWAVPGSIFSGTSAGCHRLLRDGARLAASAADVLADLPPELLQPLLPFAEPAPADDAGGPERPYGWLVEVLSIEEPRGAEESRPPHRAVDPARPLLAPRSRARTASPGPSRGSDCSHLRKACPGLADFEHSPPRSPPPGLTARRCGCFHPRPSPPSGEGISYRSARQSAGFPAPGRIPLPGKDAVSGSEVRKVVPIARHRRVPRQGQDHHQVPREGVHGEGLRRPRP